MAATLDEWRQLDNAITLATFGGFGEFRRDRIEAKRQPVDCRFKFVEALPVVGNQLAMGLLPLRRSTARSFAAMLRVS